MLGPAIVYMLLFGGIITKDGTEAGYWDNKAVVYCEITKVEAVRETAKMNRQLVEGQTTTVVLKPIAALTGTIDPTSVPTIRAYTVFGLKWCGELTQPTDGAKAIVVIETYGEGKFAIPNGAVLYMPDKLGICEVKNFDDPKVTETIENLRKLRGKQREEVDQKTGEKKKADTKAPLEKQPAK